jgi:hypothetical protein
MKRTTSAATMLVRAHMKGLLWTSQLFVAGVVIDSGVNKAFRPLRCGPESCLT